MQVRIEHSLSLRSSSPVNLLDVVLDSNDVSISVPGDNVSIVSLESGLLAFASLLVVDQPGSLVQTLLNGELVEFLGGNWLDIV